MEMLSSSDERKTKWQQAFARFSAWDTNRQRQIQEQEARVFFDWLMALKLPSYDILEVGCGNGYFGKVLIERLTDAKVSFTYHFTDFLPECVEHARSLTSGTQNPERLSYSVLDVYEINEVLPEGSQSVIVSTGFASAVTYKEVVPKVAAVLKPGGVLICDFVNDCSPLVFGSRPLKSLKALFGLLRTRAEDVVRNDKRYHFGLIGLTPFFAAHGLALRKHRTIRLRRNPLICLFEKK